MSSVTTLPFAGGELCSFDPYDSNCVEITSAGAFDATYARCAIHVGGSASGCSSPTWTAASTFWFHGELAPQGASNGSTNTALQFFRSGVEIVRLEWAYGATITLTLKTLQAGVMTTVGSSAVVSLALNTLDIQIVAGSGGSATLYVAGTSRITGTSLSHTGFSGVDQIALRGSWVLDGSSWSQVICQSTSTIGLKLWTIPPTGSGANTAWTNTYTEVDEIVYSDADKIVSTAANDIETYTHSTTLTGIVQAIVVSARANKGASGPQNLRHALRTSATNYFSAADIALGAGFQATSTPWTTNPNTSAAWVTATANAIEYGVKALT